MSTPAPTSSCSNKMGTLISVVLAGKVSQSLMPGIQVGDEMTVSFLAETTKLHREVVGQGVVYDGIAPYKVCDDDFEVTFSSGVRAHYLPPETPPVAPIDIGAPETASGLYFSLMKARTVYDGAWVSSTPSNSQTGVPLDMYDSTSAYGGIFDVSCAAAGPFPTPLEPSWWRSGLRPCVAHPCLQAEPSPPARVARFERHAVPSLDALKAVGSYDASSSVKASLKIWKDWTANFVIKADFDGMTIAKAPAILPGRNLKEEA